MDITPLATNPSTSYDTSIDWVTMGTIVGTSLLPEEGTVDCPVTMVTNSSTEYPPPVAWTWTPIPWEWWEITQLVLAVVGIVGNGLVMAVLFRSPCDHGNRGRRNQRHTTDILIAALAFADFMTSLFNIPRSRIATLPEGTIASEVYCRVVHSSMLMWTSFCTSIYTLTTISVERMIAVRYPLRFRVIVSPGRTTSLAVGIWVLSLALNSFNLFVNIAQDGSCKTVFSAAGFGKFRIALGLSVFFVEYLIPVVVMVVAHFLTIRALQQHSQSMVSGTGNRRGTNNNLLVARRRVVEMLFVVVVCFIVCWTPDQIGYLIFNLGLIDRSHDISDLYRCLIILAFVNSCVNPFIYAARNANFRKAVMGRFSRGRGGDQPVFGEDDQLVFRTSIVSDVTTTSTMPPIALYITNTSNRASQFSPGDEIQATSAIGTDNVSLKKKTRMQLRDSRPD